MLFSVCGLQAYCLSFHAHRKANIARLCARLGLNFLFAGSSETRYSHQKNVASSLLVLLSEAIARQKYPFVLFEDDAALIDSMPEVVEIPTHADIVYWGVSDYLGGQAEALSVTHYSDTMYRVYGALSGHALVIPTEKSAQFYYAVAREALATNVFNDVILANRSRNKLFLTPKNGPYFYQDDARTRQITNIKWSRLLSRSATLPAAIKEENVCGSQPTVGVLLIATWKYQRFIDKTIAGIRKHFFPNSRVKIFLHTDSVWQHDADVTIYLPHKPWPEITLQRFRTFLAHQDKYDTDYLFYLDVDVDIFGAVEENILHDFAVTAHYGYIGTRGTPETNSESAACIYPHETLTYVCGGFFGGARRRFLTAAEEIQRGIEQDSRKNIIAVWHDESHLNRYVINHAAETTILSHKYLCNESIVSPRYAPPDVRMSPHTDEKKGFNKFDDQSASDIKPLYAATRICRLTEPAAASKTALHVYVTHQAVFSSVWRRLAKAMRKINCVDYLLICGFHKTVFFPEQRTLFLNCNDHYEGLPEKMLAAYRFLESSPAFEPYDYFVKIDADYELTEPVTGDLLTTFRARRLDYGGKVINSTYRGYHIGRCSPGSRHNFREYSGPCGHHYCQGGPAYILSRRALRLLKNEIVTPEQIYEDMFVGLLLRKHGIAPVSVPVSRFVRHVGYAC